MIRVPHMIRVATLLTLITVLSSCGGSTRKAETSPAPSTKETTNPVVVSQEEAAPAESSLKNVKVYFKLDSRITRGMFMGDRWVSPPTYAPGPQSGKEYVLDARAEGVDK